MPFTLVLPRLSNCCFCFSLRTGSLIIGYVSTILSLFFMALVSVSIYVVATYVQRIKGNELPEHSPEEVARVSLWVYLTQAYNLLVFLMLTIINIMLIVGVHANKPRLLRYYFNCGLFLLVNAFILVVVWFMFVGFGATIPLLVWCVIHFLCLLVVRSTLLEMEEQGKRAPPVYELQNLYGPPAPRFSC